MVVLGNFNDILESHEKVGGNARSLASMANFNDFVSRNQMVDLGYVEHMFAWQHRYKGKNVIEIRLDRVLVSQIDGFGSEHTMLLLSLVKESPKLFGRFVCQNRWLQKPDCEDVVNKVWSSTFTGSAWYILDKKSVLARELSWL